MSEKIDLKYDTEFVRFWVYRVKPSEPSSTTMRDGYDYGILEVVGAPTVWRPVGDGQYYRIHLGELELADEFRRVGSLLPAVYEDAKDGYVNFFAAGDPHCNREYYCNSPRVPNNRKLVGSIPSHTTEAQEENQMSP